MATMQAHTGHDSPFFTQAHRVIAREITSEYGAHSALIDNSGWVAGHTWTAPAPMRATNATRRAGQKAWLRRLLILIAGH